MAESTCHGVVIGLSADLVVWYYTTNVYFLVFFNSIKYDFHANAEKNDILNLIKH